MLVTQAAPWPLSTRVVMEIAGQASYPESHLVGGQRRMGNAQTLRQKLRYFVKYGAILASILLVALSCHAQSAPATQQPEMPWAQDLKKHPELLAEFGRLFEKLQKNLQFPAPRAESRLLPLLPASTMSYAAFPNYGDVTQQALQIFRQELQESAVLRDWWQHGDLATAGPKIEDSLQQIIQFQQFLGDEIVLSGSFEGQDPKLLVVAELRKPGLKKFLQDKITQLGGEAKPGVRILDLQDLAAAKDEPSSKDLLVLVRPDYVVAAMDLTTLRNFNSRLASQSREFLSTPFAQRIVKEYASQITVLAAADLHKIIDQTPPNLRQDSSFQRSGFADVKYLVWEHKMVDNKTISQSELSFNSPRRGAASWLAKTGPLTGLDFVSPKAMAATTVLLASPAQIFEDLKGMYTNPSSSPFASLPAFEKMLNLNLKDDLLGTLGGEVTFELDSVTPTKPEWKAILSVRDTGHLQQTLTTLLAAGHMEAEKFDEDGVTYSTVQIPSSTPPYEVDYAFVDGHLILAPSREKVAEAVRLHKTGESLAKSKTFLASLPPGHPLEASALFYQDPVAMASLQLQQFAPDIARSLAQSSKQLLPAVVSFYGEESAIRESSSSGAYDFGAVMVVAAIAIPNLLRSKMAANEASAVGSVRTVNVSEVIYASTYPQRNFAPDLATLGLDPHNPKVKSPDHAALLDGTLGNASCTGDAWCTKSGYNFRVKAICKLHKCDSYLTIATPANDNTGARSFCSTSDGIIRYKTTSPPSVPATISECKSWSPLQ
jgi:type IV pilus assembly protein PilA